MHGACLAGSSLKQNWEFDFLVEMQQESISYGT
jgi:hypothetical protein